MADKQQIVAFAFPVLGRVYGAMLDMLFPPRCVVCGAHDAWLCAGCIAATPRLEQPCCGRCAQPLQIGALCSHCAAEPPAFDGVYAPFLMRGPVREAIHLLKYNGVRVAALALGSLMADTIITAPHAVDVVIPVPLHVSRSRSRGYNQAELLAREIGGRLNAPVRPELLQRARRTPPLARSSDAAARRSAVADAFRAAGDGLGGARVLLVDDVCTTGATLHACASALKQSGAAFVWGVVAARDP
jgi:ComF family protein